MSANVVPRSEGTSAAIVNVATFEAKIPSHRRKETNEAVAAKHGGGGPLISGLFVSTSPGDNARRGGSPSGEALDAPLKRREFLPSFLITI